MSAVPQPRVVVFDLGKVLVDFDYARCARRLAARASCSVNQIQQVIDHSPLLVQYETGRIKKDRFYEEICRLTGYTARLSEFEPAFADIFSAIEPMIEAHRQLREKKVPTYILSNTNDIAVAHIRRTFPFFSNFDGYLFSFEQGVMKPDEQIYAITENVIGRPAYDILYIDDRAENIEPARRRGWNVIHHVSPEQSIEVLKRFGLVGGSSAAG